MKTCFVFICNAAYLVPALVSASQARTNVKPELADIFVFNIGPPSRESDLVEAAAPPLGVRYVRHDLSVLDGLSLAYGRMMINRLLPDGDYKDFVYADSDTQVWGRLDELASAPVPAGRILATRDPMTVMIAAGGGMGERASAHISSLNLPDRGALDYINSGVMKVNLNDWSDIAAECVRFAHKANREYLHKDQDIINTVASGRFDLMSFRWNFPAFLLDSGVEQFCEPRLVHFMSNPRPWQGPFHPWGDRAFQPYETFTRAYPELRPYWPRLSRARYVKYILQQRYKREGEGRFWKSRRFHAEFRRSEASVGF